MKRLSLLTVVALVGTIAFASVAEAHVLSLQRAERASRIDTRALCFQIPDCVAWAVGDPRRRSAHVVRVPAAHAYSNGVVCGWIDRWSIRKGSRRLRYSTKVFEDTLVCRQVAAEASSTKGSSAAEIEDAIRDEALATR
jgi:hypothetical protein